MIYIITSLDSQQLQYLIKESLSSTGLHSLKFPTLNRIRRQKYTATAKRPRIESRKLPFGICCQKVQILFVDSFSSSSPDRHHSDVQEKIIITFLLSSSHSLPSSPRLVLIIPSLSTATQTTPYSSRRRTVISYLCFSTCPIRSPQLSFR